MHATSILAAIAALALAGSAALAGDYAELEALGFLQLTLAANEKVAWTGGFATVA